MACFQWLTTEVRDPGSAPLRSYHAVIARQARYGHRAAIGSPVRGFQPSLVFPGVGQPDAGYIRQALRLADRSICLGEAAPLRARGRILYQLTRPESPFDECRHTAALREGRTKSDSPSGLLRRYSAGI